MASDKQYILAFEPIEVITVFEKDDVKPLRFRWKGHVHKVLRVNRSWCVPLLEGKAHFFSVSTERPGSVELIFNTNNLNWYLNETI